MKYRSHFLLLFPCREKLGPKRIGFLMLHSRAKVFETIEQHQAELRRLGVRGLQLFGSTVRDETHASSDLDFVVQLEKNSFRSYMDVKFFLEDLFLCSVDLVLSDTIKPQLRDSILQEAVHAPGF